jgi:hypothetical protein
VLAVVQELEHGFNEQVLPRLIEAYPMELAGQLHYFLVFWCQAGREKLVEGLGEDTVNDMLAMVTEYGINPDKCHLVQADEDDEKTIDTPPEWFRRPD